MKSHRCAIVLLLGCLPAAAALVGCKGGQDGSASWSLNGMVHRLSGPTPQEQVAMAFDPNDPDRRREGVVGLSQHDWGLKEPYLKGYATILKSDGDPLVRAAAVRALGKARDPNYLPDVVACLSDPSEMVRRDAGAALDSVTGPAAVEPLRASAAGDADRIVRANCARALRHYFRPDVYETLVQCLSDEAYVVQYEAHASLVALCGRDLGTEPGPWRRASLPEGPPPEDVPWWRRLGWGKIQEPQPAGDAQPARPRAKDGTPATRPADRPG